VTALSNPTEDDPPLPTFGVLRMRDEERGRNGMRWFVVYTGESKSERIWWEVTKDVEDSPFKYG
jgi:hypothetical protein